MRKLTTTLFTLCFSSLIYAQGTWHNLQSGLTHDNSNNGTSYAVCADTVNNVVYAAGVFDYADTIFGLNIAQWDGTTWNNIGSVAPPPAYATALIMYKGNLMVGTSNGDVPSYDGKKWSNLPNFDGPVYAFTIFNDTLYAGGQFTTCSNGGTFNNIAKWDGSNWLAVDGGVSGTKSVVRALTVYNNELIAGGTFVQAGTSNAKDIASFDGSNWSAISGGISNTSSAGTVYALENYKGSLYAGGTIDSAGGNYAYGIASWNGSNWSAVTGVSSYLTALKSFNGYLFLGGTSGYLTKYDGQTVSVVDSGTNGTIYSFTTLNGSLYMGGYFDSVGKTVLANAIAKWTPAVNSGINPAGTTSNSFSVYPIPAVDAITVNSQSSIKEIQVTGLNGQTITINSGAADQLETKINISSLPSGIYFMTVKTDIGSSVKKFVVTK